MKKIFVFSHATSILLILGLSIGTAFILANSAVAGPPMRNAAHMSVNHGGHGGPGGGHGGGGNHNTNVNVNVNHNGPGPGGGGHHHNDGAAFVAGAITTLTVGAIVAAASMPPSCTTVVVNNVSYRQCGSDWYQPYYSGTEVQYMVVAPPR